MIITLPGADFSSDYIGTLDYWFITPIIGTGAHYDGPRSFSKDESTDVDTIRITFDADYRLAEEGLSVKQTNGQDVNYITTTELDGSIIIKFQEITGHIIIRISTLNTATGISYVGRQVYNDTDEAFIRDDNNNWIMAHPELDNYRTTAFIPVDSGNSVWINPVVIGKNQNIAMGIVVPSTSQALPWNGIINPIYWGSFGVDEAEAQALVAQGYDILPNDYNYGPVSIASLEEEYGMTIKGIKFQAFGKSRFDTTEAIIYGDPHCAQAQFITKNLALKQYDDGTFAEVPITSTNTTYMTGNYAVTGESRVWINEVFIKNNTWPCVGLYGEDGMTLLGVVTPDDFHLSVNSELTGTEAFAAPQHWPHIKDLETKKKLVTNSVKYVRFVAWDTSASGEGTQARVYEW